MKIYTMLIMTLFMYMNLVWGQKQTPKIPPSEKHILAKMQSPGNSYWDISEAAENYFQAKSSTPSKSFSKAFSRWNFFWSKRIGHSGKLEEANQKLINMDPYDICADNGDWEMLDTYIPNRQVSGIVTAVYAPPGQGSNPSLIYLGSNTGGLWKTTNGGQSWQCMTDNLRMPALGINSIVGPPNDPNTIYIATGNTGAFMGKMYGTRYGVGVLKSTNGGMSWQKTDLSYNGNDRPTIHKLFMHPNNPNLIYAIGNKKLYITNNGGGNPNDQINHWPATNLGSIMNMPWYESLYDIDLLFNQGPQGQDVIFVSTVTIEGNQSARILRNIAGNTAWSNVTPSIINSNTTSSNGIWSDSYSMATSASTPSTLYVSFTNFSSSSVKRPFMKSTNLGLIWEEEVANVQNSLGAGLCKQLWNGPERPVYEINDLNPDIRYIGINCLLKTTNAGGAKTGGTTSFITLYNGNIGGSNTHADIRAVQIYQAEQSGKADVVLIGTDGGISLKNLQGTQNLNSKELILTQYFDIADPSSKLNGAGGGAQDNGVYTRRKNGTWVNQIIGDGGTTIYDWSNSEQMFARGNERITRAKTDGGSFSTLVSVPPTNQFEPFNFRQDPAKPDVLYAFRKKKFFKISQLSTSGQRTTLFDFGNSTFNGAMSSWGNFEVSKSNPDIIYLATTKHSQAFWKSSDGGSTWVQKPCPYLRWDHANAIAIHPNDPDKIWMALSGFRGKVIYSDDGGDNWTLFAYEKGLPKFPITDIIYQENSDGVLFAGTDVGVFRYEPSLQVWECFNKHLPVAIITDLEIDYCKGTIQAGTYGRGIWESPLPNLQPIHISQATTWNNANISSMQDIIIDPGASLTITGTLRMGIGKKISVSRNASLILEGSITGNCDTWQGIEVYGNSSKAHPGLSQILSGNHPDHGVLIMRKGSKLEHARNAVSLSKAGNLAYSGGIILADDATFLNNRRSVEFVSFRPSHSNASNSDNNASYIRNSSFIHDAESRFLAQDIAASITLWDVRSVQIEANDFIRENFRDIAFEHRGIGIYSIDAAYQAEALCTQVGPALPNGSFLCLSYKPNRFLNLYRGIEINNTQMLDEVLSVDRNLFDNCKEGIVLVGGDNNISLIRNEITTLQFENSSTSGIYLHGSRGYQLEENLIKAGETAPSQSNIGIYVYDNGAHANEIYKNTLQGLQMGIVATELNIGLQIKCNTFENIEFYNIMAYNPEPNGLYGPSLLNQGYCPTSPNDPSYYSAPAGNLIDDGPCLTASNTDHLFILNPSSLNINYHHHQGFPYDPLCVNSQVFPQDCGIPFEEGRSCPSHLIEDNSSEREERRGRLREDYRYWTAEAREKSSADNQKGFASKQHQLYLQRLIQSYLEDDMLEAAFKLLLADDSPYAKEMLVALYLQQDKLDQAQNILTSFEKSESEGLGQQEFYQVLIDQKRARATPSSLHPQVEAKLRSAKEGLLRSQSAVLLKMLKGEKIETPYQLDIPELSKDKGQDFLPATSEINSYPNPASNQLTISFKLAQDVSDQARILMRNLMGKGIMSLALPKEKLGEVRLDLQEIPAGLYFIILEDAGLPIRSQKVLIEK
ncbi:MAG: T9SS type A sorting domain-containing protein [Bacteroidota bacterium]